LSGEHVNALVERSRLFIEIADTLLGQGRGYDVAAFSLEQAAQLRLKAALARLFGDWPRIHGIRQLIARPSALLEEAGLREPAERLRRFAADNRGLLWLLEEAYMLARYGDRAYTRAEVESLRALVEQLVRLIEEVEEDAVRGAAHD